MISKIGQRPNPRLKLLFVTRKFPPAVGGLEKLSFELYLALKGKSNISLIAWGRSQRWLPLFLPYALIKGLYLLKTKKIQTIYLADALLTPMGIIFKIFFPKTRLVITVNGLDITYPNPLYQFLIPNLLKKSDKLTAISGATIEEAVKRGLRREDFVLINPGINWKEYELPQTKQELRRKLEEELRIKLKNKFILLTVGRLVKRKGHAWFIKNVLPKLPNVIYLIAGTGPEEEKLTRLVKKDRYKDKAHLLGKISDLRKKELLNASDLFIMPNIKVPKDIEGFGIVAIEASAAGLPIVASDLEGIKDTTENGKNGYLVQSGNAEEFTKTIKMLVTSPKKLKRLGNNSKIYVKGFDWDKVGNLYLKVLK